MKMIVVGYGSMGKRRIRLMREIRSDMEIFVVDSNLVRLEQAKKDGYPSYQNLDLAIQIIKNLTIGFVCTPPGHHSEIIIKLIRAGINVFTELNLTSEDYELIENEAMKQNIAVFMSSTLLYKRQIELINNWVKAQTKPVTYIYHVGQYLPDWHPWESYTDFFASQKSTNGVKEILAIQLPWIVEVFGQINNAYANWTRCTNLDIDFSDSIAMSFSHTNGNTGVFVADVVSRVAVTNLEIIGENLHIRWSGHNDDMYYFNAVKGKWQRIYAYEEDEHIQGYADNISENPYRDELKDFLSTIENGTVPKYSIKKDNYILSIIEELEKSQ